MIRTENTNSTRTKRLNRHAIFNSLVLLLSATLGVNSCFAFEVITHKQITGVAMNRAQGVIDQRLQRMGLQNGLNTVLNGSGVQLAARDWSVRGSAQEDDFQLCRVVHHFHDPLQDITHAGLLGGQFVPLCTSTVGSPMSSVLWSQKGAGEQPGLSMSWRDARVYQYPGLTASSTTTRELYLALMFQAVGHVMHLIQDSASPAHTRNDSHLPVDPDYVHEWFANQNNVNPDFLNGLPQVSPSTSLLTSPSSHSLVNIPIANLFDTNIYNNPNPNPDTTVIADAFGNLSQNPNSGISEFSNANFFSDDTITDYPHPNPYDTSELENSGNGYFLLRRRSQVFLEHAAVNLLQSGALQGIQSQQVNHPDFMGLTDSLVMTDYAGKLLPSAIGYSSIVPLYFFRGDMEIAIHPDVPSLITIKNTSAIAGTTPENISGRVVFYYDDVNGNRHQVPNADYSVTLSPGEEDQFTLFTIPSNPAPLHPDQYVAVFRGQIGQELSALFGNEVQLDSRSLELSKVGTGQGKLQTDPSGIDCDASCTSDQENYPFGTTVHLTANPSHGYKFKEWGGDCSGTDETTDIEMTQARNCTAEFKSKYTITQLTFANTDHKWPTVNNHGDVVWSEKVNSYWQVFDSNINANGAAFPVSSGDRNHERPAISDDGTIAWFQDNSGGGIGYQVIRRDPLGSESIVEQSTRNGGQQRVAGKNFGISSDGKTISYYTFYGAGQRRFNVSGLGELTNGSGGRGDFYLYEYPDINFDNKIVYQSISGYSISLASTQQPFNTAQIGVGQFPHIADGVEPEIVYIRNGNEVVSKLGLDDPVKVDNGLWADVNNNGDIVFEKQVNGVSQIFVAKPD